MTSDAEVLAAIITYTRGILALYDQLIVELTERHAELAAMSEAIAGPQNRTAP